MSAELRSKEDAITAAREALDRDDVGWFTAGLIGDAAVWIARTLADGKILATTDPEGHGLARELASVAGGGWADEVRQKLQPLS